ncbi:Aste57867_13498 [Aphanomyces stellatus]|uniref:Aste57867_13498 protein n=1 Tax=Aphanomyces stellatus TaxID=120398 RepID=A0A485KYJ5_9STRA|nr:hypothetical protein As57867_013448 [Aphanomyces stellatus]VFT90336.1 Aste57867_13498 [Aphanomyces stellatus]
MPEKASAAPAADETPAEPTEAELLANDRAILDFADDDEDDEEDDEEDEDEEDEGKEGAGERPAKRQRGEDKPKDTSKKVEVPRKATFTRADKVNAAIMKATGNSGGGFAMFSTSSSVPMMAVYKKEIAAARKLVTAKKFQDAFCIALASFLSMQDYDIWFSDTEDHRGVETLFTSYFKLWTDIFKSDDTTLGLKGRDVLIDELRKFGNSAKEGFEYEFSWFE